MEDVFYVIIYIKKGILWYCNTLYVVLQKYIMCYPELQNTMSTLAYVKENV